MVMKSESDAGDYAAGFGARLVLLNGATSIRIDWWEDNIYTTILVFH